VKPGQIKAKNESRITVSEMKPMTQAVDYTWKEDKIN
jgi:hypothetical protein